jgi:hypothetical protein
MPGPRRVLQHRDGSDGEVDRSSRVDLYQR